MGEEQANGAPQVEITVRRDGPVVIRGPVRLALGDDTVDADVVFLCRCGHSEKKPFCDGTHKRSGFRAEGEEPPPRTGSKGAGVATAAPEAP